MTDAFSAVESELRRASVLTGLGRYSEASIRLGQVLAGEPQNVQAWCLLARCRLGLEDGDAALHAADTAASLDPTLEWAHRLRSIALANLGRHAESLVAAREAVRWGPHSWEPFGQLAAAAASNREFVAARAAVNQAMMLAPNEPAVHVMAGVLELSGRRRSRKKRALEAFRRALAKDPQNTAALNSIADLQLSTNLFGGGSLAQAADGFAAAVRVDPRQQASRRHLELVVRVFLERVTYLLALCAYVGYRTRDSHAMPIRCAPIVLLSIPAVFASRFVIGLSQGLRSYLVEVLRSRGVREPTGLAVLSIVLLVAAAVSPPGWRLFFAGAALLTAAICWLWLDERSRQQKVVAGGSDRPHAVDTPMLWFLAVALFLMTGFMIAAVIRSGAGTLGAVIAVAFFTAFLAVLNLIRHRLARG